MGYGGRDLRPHAMDHKECAGPAVQSHPDLKHVAYNVESHCLLCELRLRASRSYHLTHSGIRHVLDHKNLFTVGGSDAVAERGRVAMFARYPEVHSRREQLFVSQNR